MKQPKGLSSVRVPCGQGGSGHMEGRMKICKMSALLAASFFACLTFLMTVTRADDYPSRAITVVVPFPPGGPSDVVARIVAEGMGRALNQTLIIENLGGAGGTIGKATHRGACPCGYTMRCTT